MIIKRLTLHNFGVYASYNSYHFSYKKSKNVTLIGGMNGRGKTTFLEAVLLALYGQNSFAFTESKYKSYGEYLRSHTNTSDGSNESYVELEFDMDEEHELNSYIVTRSWNSLGKRTKDKVSVIKNGTEDNFLTQNWTMFIESILPSGLANFFFFDGEKIAELAEGETDSHMKDSIKSLLGINVIDALQSDLNRVIRRFNDEQVGEYSAIQLEELRTIKEEAEEKLATIESEKSQIESDIDNIKRKIAKKKEEFEAKGGNIADQSKSLFSEKIRLNSQLEQIENNFVGLAATDLPLIMVKPMLKRILNQSARERESKTMQLAVNKIGELYNQFDGKNKSAVSYFIEYVKKQTNKSQTDTVFDLSENAYVGATMLYNSFLDSIKQSYISEKQARVKFTKRIDEIDSYLSVDIDEKAIQRIYKKICELENKKIELEVLLKSKDSARAVAHGEVIKATTEFNRCVENSLQTMEREDDLKRLQGYALLAQTVAERYKKELQRAKVEELAQTMTECYKKLLGKNKFIDRIEMDPGTLDYRYIDKKGFEIPKKSLSAGEKQLMIISMLWALAKCSGKNLPVIIDTPLARLDSIHRKTLIDKYFPNASNQTIILSTDAEIDATYYNVIKKHVGNEFTLVYDDELQRSTIEDGYFKGEIG